MPKTSRCTVETCNNTNMATSRLCWTHYGRWKRYGSVELPPKRICQAPFCTVTARPPEKVWCRGHRDNPETRCMGPKHMPGAMKSDELLALMSAVETDDCIEWPRGRNPQNGYGQLTGNRTAHRAACTLHHGDPPGDKTWTLHSCNNPPCFNPRHLRWGTPQENIDDRQRDGVWHAAMKKHRGKPIGSISPLAIWLARGYGRGRYAMLSDLTGLSVNYCGVLYKSAITTE